MSDEMKAFAAGEQPAASITVNGHTYVPEARVKELERALMAYGEVGYHGVMATSPDDLYINLPGTGALEVAVIDGETLNSIKTTLDAAIIYFVENYSIPSTDEYDNDLMDVLEHVARELECSAAMARVMGFRLRRDGRVRNAKAPQPQAPHTSE